jgi:peptidoglycan-N-acetylglucosamine deacetylase
MDKGKKCVYLTFDDGPVPEATEFVLETLSAYNAKATFFCIGSNVEKHPEIFNRIISEGHSVGNHSWSHLNGWQTSDKKYIEDAIRAKSVIPGPLFRPPYGRIKFSQSKELRKYFKIVMWDVLSYDYDNDTSPETCLNNILKYTRNGSLIVFHDSMKALPKLKYALPESLQKLTDQGYSFGIL